MRLKSEHEVAVKNRMENGNFIDVHIDVVFGTKKNFDILIVNNEYYETSF